MERKMLIDQLWMRGPAFNKTVESELYWRARNETGRLVKGHVNAAMSTINHVNFVYDVRATIHHVHVGVPDDEA